MQQEDDGSQTPSSSDRVPGAADSLTAPKTGWGSMLGPSVIAIALTSVGVLPVFLTGSLAVQIRPDLKLSHAGLGMVTGAFYLTGALTSMVTSRIVEWLGPARTMRMVALLQGVVGVVIALAARTPLELGALVALAGTVNGAMQPAVNTYLLRQIPAGHQGLAFGVKQAAIPLATLLSGLAVPAVALTVGWRYAFGALVVLGIAGAAIFRGGSATRAQEPLERGSTSGWDADQVLAGEESGPKIGLEMPGALGIEGLVPSWRGVRERTKVVGRSRPPVARNALVVLGVGLGLGAGVGNGLAAFLVTAAVGVGFSPGAAGLVGATGSLAAVAIRIGVGAFADRSRLPKLRIVATMLLVGSLGYLGLALGERAVFLPAALVAYGIGWGWNGLFSFTVAGSHPEAAARATAIVQMGAYTGGVVVPLGMGLIAEHASFGWVWCVAAGLIVGAAVAMVVGRRLLRAWLADR